MTVTVRFNPEDHGWLVNLHSLLLSPPKVANVEKSSEALDWREQLNKVRSDPIHRVLQGNRRINAVTTIS